VALVIDNKEQSIRFLFSAVALCAAAFTLPAAAQTIFPLNRAEILAGSDFDFKVEFAGHVDPAQVKVTNRGGGYAKVLGKSAELIAREDGKEVSSLLLHDAAIGRPGHDLVTASDGTKSRSVTWNVYATPNKRVAKNLILFIGDGFSIAHQGQEHLVAQF
jgi:alkaline phosphatase